MWAHEVPALLTRRVRIPHLSAMIGRGMIETNAQSSLPSFNPPFPILSCHPGSLPPSLTHGAWLGYSVSLARKTAEAATTEGRKPRQSYSTRVSSARKLPRYSNWSEGACRDRERGHPGEGGG